MMMLAGANATHAAGPALLPVPQSVKMADGSLSISPKTRIVALDQKLMPLAAVLGGEIRLATGLSLQTSAGPAAAGDITLALGDVAGSESYRLDIKSDGAHVVGQDYKGAAWGTVTLLQSLAGGAADASLPLMAVADHPKYPYRGFMKDVARQDVPIEQLFAVVEMCRLYKTNYLHVHLSDDHAFVFPSEKYPKLGDRNTGAHSGPAPKVYDLARLKELVKYADERGVTIVPEIDSPGHTGAMRLSLPDLLDAPVKPGGEARLGLVNMCSEKTYAVMDDLVGELCDVFASSPYIHIGFDEVGADAVKRAPEYADFIAKHQLKNSQDVFAYYTQRVTDMVAKRGKLAIAWEGVPLDREDPKKMILMSWTMGNGPPTMAAIKKGFRIINAPNHAFNGQQEIADNPLFKDPLGYNFHHDLRGLNVDEKTKIPAQSPLLLGGQMNDWESTWEYAVRIARRSVGAASSNAWNPTSDQPVEPLVAEFESTDALLGKLISPVQVKITREDKFDQKKAVQLLRNNTLFTQPIGLDAQTAVPDATVRFTTDGTLPTAASPAFTSPLTIDKTTQVWLGLFDSGGKQLAPMQRLPFEKINYESSLALGKPVTASSREGKEPTEAYLTDGFAKFDIWRGWWGAAPIPQWAQVDLGEAMPINRIKLFPYWDGHRYYQYTISVSTDGNDWKEVVDESKNTTPSTPDGNEFKFDTTTARYVRVNVTKNSANSAAHLVDLRVFGPTS